MKTAIVCLAALAASNAVAQQPAAKIRPAPAVQGKSQEELRRLRAEKLADPVFDGAGWITDYDEARRRAAETGRFVLVYFTRSYAP